MKNSISKVIMSTLFSVLCASCAVEESDSAMKFDTPYPVDSQSTALQPTEQNDLQEENQDNECSLFFDELDIRLHHYQDACRDHALAAFRECRGRGGSYSLCNRVSEDGYDYCNTMINQCIEDPESGRINPEFEKNDPFRYGDWPVER